MANNIREKETLAPKPSTVSSTSSIETVLSRSNNVSGIASSSAIKPAHGQILSSSNERVTQRIAPTSTSRSSIAVGLCSQQMSLMPRPNHFNTFPSPGIVPAPSHPNTNTIPEFLYQLTKMLTDNNRDVIEWSNGKIEVHNPHKLESQVLNKYFRHSKFASFQRQLNYFGFRKLAGKGKMAPCSYVNDETASEIGSLLQIRRKTGNEIKGKRGKKRGRHVSTDTLSEPQASPENSNVNPVLAGILYKATNESHDSLEVDSKTLYSSPNISPQTEHSTQQALARVAVGKGIKHRFSVHATQNLTNVSAGGTGSKATSVQAGLSALAVNYESSLNGQTTEQSIAQINASHGPSLKNQTEQQATQVHPSSSYVPGSLRRDDSLIDLAMIPLVDDNDWSANVDSGTPAGLAFVDFPWHDPSFLPSDET